MGFRVDYKQSWFNEKFYFYVYKTFWFKPKLFLGFANTRKEAEELITRNTGTLSYSIFYDNQGYAES